MKFIKEFVLDQRILVVLIVILSGFIYLISRPFSSALLPSLCAGFVLLYLMEYVAHRFFLHGVMKILMPGGYQKHVKHHQHPTDMRYLLTPNFYNLTVYPVIFFGVLFITHSVYDSTAVCTTNAVAQLYYEWTHFVSHRPIVPRTPWGKWMKKYHLLHHYKNENHWFGVTNHSLDVLFGTYRQHQEVDTVSPFRGGHKNSR